MTDPVLAAFVAACAMASWRQDDAPAPAVVDDGWTLRPRFEVLFEDNVFHLSKDSRRRLRDDRPDDRVSGRYDDMNAEHDVILITELELRRELDDSAGDEFRLEPGLRYLAHTVNPRMSHPEFFVEMRQEIASGSALGLDLEYEMDVFARNYLAEVTDFVGSVSADERRYEPGTYDEWTAAATLEQRLWRRSSASSELWRTLGIRRLDLDAAVAVGRRWYDVPFSNRDRDRVTAKLGLTAGLSGGWSASAGYRYDQDRTDDGREVLIRNEDDFDLDFNLDGDRVDQDVRAVERVDRSKNQHEVEAGVDWAFAKDWSAGVHGSLRVQDYLSHEPVDVTHRGRVDRGRELRIDLDWDVSDGCKTSLSAGVSREKSNRSAEPDADDEETAYNNFFVGLRASFRF